MELKVTSVDSMSERSLVAGERIVLKMITIDEEAPEELLDSHLWEKREHADRVLPPGPVGGLLRTVDTIRVHVHAAGRGPKCRREGLPRHSLPRV